MGVGQAAIWEKLVLQVEACGRCPTSWSLVLVLIRVSLCAGTPAASWLLLASPGSTQPPAAGRRPAGLHDKVDAAAGWELVVVGQGGSCSLGGTRELSSLPASVTSLHSLTSSPWPAWSIVPGNTFLHYNTATSHTLARGRLLTHTNAALSHPQRRSRGSQEALGKRSKENVRRPRWVAEGPRTGTLRSAAAL
ncbi:hypothetical protein E2C01_028897 [Portunus trituberculatus]|uniref:Uncharacterized protein n=1 Tax=Portunus trituberculatus TaxID=210409 RepID=A0A5B7ERA8_PORTR|nr:hypothetical protein [Portunus trituberculatus]